MAKLASKLNKSDVNLVVFYDGKCVLCNQTIRFLIKVDRKQVLKFAPLQGETANSLNKYLPKIEEDPASVVFVRNMNDETNRQIFLRSTAILTILGEIGGVWKLFSWLKLLPPFIRDSIYNLIAQNRYRWFGKYDECLLPTPEIQERFLP